MDVEANALRVQNFLYYFTLRAGTLVILWSSLLFSFNFVAILIALTITADHNLVYLYMLIALFSLGTMISFMALLYFPATSRKYSRGSAHAKWLKYFSLHNGFTATFLMGIFSTEIIRYVVQMEPHDSFNFHNIVISGTVITFVAGSFVHFAAVTYSFYASTVEMYGVNMNTNDLNASIEKNCIPMTTNGVQTYGIRLPMPPPMQKPTEDGSSCNTNFT